MSKRLANYLTNLSTKYTTPVDNTGMWYQDNPVVVPSNEITMKGPNGESDYFKEPIVGVGTDTGETQIMEPGKEYSFPNDRAVYERKMQSGGLYAVGPYDQMMAPKKDNYLLPDINRPSYQDEFGEMRSEYKMGFNSDGQETLIPTVVQGKQLSEDEAIDNYFRTGLHMGKYNTVNEAEYASKMRTAKYNMLQDPVRFKMQFGGYQDNAQVVVNPGPNAKLFKSIPVKNNNITPSSELPNFERLPEVEIKVKRGKNRSKSNESKKTLKQIYEEGKSRMKYNFNNPSTKDNTTVNQISPEITKYTRKYKTVGGKEIDYFTAKGERDGLLKKVVDVALSPFSTNASSFGRVALQQNNNNSNIKPEELAVLGTAISNAQKKGMQSGDDGTFGYDEYPGGRKPLNEVYNNVLGYKDKGFLGTAKDRTKATLTDGNYRQTLAGSFTDPSFQMQTTLGQTKYSQMPNGDYIVYDDYDFNFHSDGERANLLNDAEDVANNTDLFHSTTSYIVPKEYVNSSPKYKEKPKGYVKQAEEKAVGSTKSTSKPLTTTTLKNEADKIIKTTQNVGSTLQQKYTNTKNQVNTSLPKKVDNTIKKVEKPIKTVSSDIQTKVNNITNNNVEPLTDEMRKVQNYQKMLNNKYGAGLDTDGAWGPKTQAAYEKYILKKAMQMGGMSIPRVNGTVVASSSLYNKYKKK